MRRFKQELTKEETENILKKQQRGFLSVHGDDNYPYTIPMNYYYQDRKIFLHSAKEGHFKDSIKTNDKVCFCGSVRNTVQKPNPNFNIEHKSKLFSSFINSINFFHLIIL